MLTELPTWANLGPVKGGVEVGDPTRVRITQNLYGLPSFQLDQKSLTPRGFLRRKGKAYIYREPNSTLWFLASCDLKSGDALSELDLNNGSHEKMVEEHEPVGYELRPFARPLSFAFRQVRSSIKFIDFTITKDHMNELKQFIGEDHPSFIRLTPGRLPSSVRINKDLLLQVWMHIGSN